MRGYNIEDYMGKKFNSLTLIKNLNKIDNRNSKLALFKCDCGNQKELVFTQVLSGDIKTCGCKQGYLTDFSKKKQQNSLLNFYSGNKTNKTMKNNKTGHTGISIVDGKYRARIQINHKSKHLGYFDSLDAAIKAREEAEKGYFEPLLKKTLDK